jgi:hypothetical protein
VLLAVVIGMLAISLPLAVILGVPLGGALRGVVQVVTTVLVVVAIPFIWVGAALGWVLYSAIEFLRGLAGGHSTDTGGVIGGPLVDWQGMLGPEGQNGLALGVIPFVVAVIVAFVLIRALVKRPRRSLVDGNVVEDREVERPIGMGLRRPQVRMPRRRGAPRSASEAYVASLEVLAGQPEFARLASETPAEHAGRLRAGVIGAPLGQLAADYALVEFGQRTLTPSEHRRAIERWRRIRATDRAGT